MRIAIAPAKWAHEITFLGALGETLRELGHEVFFASDPEQPRGAPWEELIIQWGGRWEWYADSAPVVYIECGWLPRWSYQVSWSGINAKHHAAGPRWPRPFWTVDDQIKLDDQLHEIRSGHGQPKRGWGYCDMTVPPDETLRVPYWLCPLQVPTDVNMDSLPEALRDPQGLIDYLCATPVVTDDLEVTDTEMLLAKEAIGRIYFKRHPAMSERQRILRAPSPHKVISHLQGQIAAYLKSDACLGVICGNSNVFHDALLWGKPATALGDGFWGKGPISMEPGTDETNAYLRHVLANQWSLEDARDVGKVERLITDATP